MIMIIWFDAVTSKEPLLFDAIAKELEKDGHEAIFTCRDYDYVVSLFDLLNREVNVLGHHGGGTLYGKLKAGNERINLLADFIYKLEKKPDFHISFACPESTRVAFGLGIPVTIINDSPHAKAVGKLTIPLSKYLVYSSCINEELWLELGAVKEQLVPYNGIDEVAWLKDFNPNSEVLETLSLSPKERFIIARPEESSAAYMLEDGNIGGTKLDFILDAIFEKYDGKAVVFPRYEEQKQKMIERYGEKIIVPPKAVDTLSLCYYSDLCVTGGATMAREAAALGTPSISYYPRHLDVLSYISSLGIPLYNEYSINNAIERSLELINHQADRLNLRNKTKEILKTLESPLVPITKILA